MSNDMNGELLMVQDFRNSEELDRLIRRKHIIFNSLRGTAAYWEKQKLQIKHMIALKGTPTAFLTFSSADLYWKDMQAYLKTYVQILKYF